jgi:hypothetical protein
MIGNNFNLKCNKYKFTFLINNLFKKTLKITLNRLIEKSSKFEFKKSKKKMSYLSNNTSTSITTNETDYSITFSLEQLYTFIDIPIILFGTIASLINVIIFSDKNFKDKIFTFLLVHSIVEFLYLFLLNFIPVPYCGVYCSFGLSHSYLACLIALAIDYYFTSCLAIFNIMVEITISLQRFLLLSNLNYCLFLKNGSPFKILLVLFIISLLFYLPELFISKIDVLPIDQIPNEYKMNSNETIDYYYITSTHFADENPNIVGYFELLTNILRGPGAMVILTIINFLTVLKFKKHINKKRERKGKSR